MSSLSQFLMYSSRSVSPSPQAEPKPRQVWTTEEDRLLAEAVAKETPANGSINWCKVASYLSRRNNKDCRKRWHYNVAHNIRKGTWTREEDQRLREAFVIYGPRWSKVAQVVKTRNGDQCWKRWYDCLDPKIDRSPWTPEEDILLLQIVSQQGRNWTEIVNTHFPNRTSLAAKNRYSILRRRQETGAAFPSPSSRSRSSTHAYRGSTGRRSKATTLSATATAAATATPSPMLMTTSQGGPQYLSPTPPTSNQLTPELGQCFTPSPLSLSDTDMESTSCSSGFGLGLLLPPSAMPMATTSMSSSSFAATDATTCMSTLSFDILPYVNNNGYNNFSGGDCSWAYHNNPGNVAMTGYTCTPDASSSPSCSPSVSASSSISSSQSRSQSRSQSSLSTSPPTLSLNSLYMPMPVVDQGLVNFDYPQTKQAQQQQQFEFMIQTPTPTATAPSMPYSSW